MPNQPLSPWFSLGKPSLYLGTWISCDELSLFPEALLRCSFTFLDEGFDGYVLLRNLFLIAGQRYTCEAARIYPDSGFCLLQLPYPSVLKTYEINERRVQVRPRQFNKKYGQGLTPAPLEILVEELQPP